RLSAKRTRSAGGGEIHEAKTSRSDACAGGRRGGRRVTGAGGRRATALLENGAAGTVPDGGPECRDRACEERRAEVHLGPRRSDGARKEWFRGRRPGDKSLRLPRRTLVGRRDRRPRVLEPEHTRSRLLQRGRREILSSGRVDADTAGTRRQIAGADRRSHA